MMFTTSGYSFASFNIPANIEDDMDDKLCLLNKAAFVNHLKAYKDFPEYIRNIKDEQIEICRGVLSFSLEEFKSIKSYENVMSEKNAIGIIVRSLENVKKDMVFSKEAMVNGYNQKKVDQYVLILKSYTSIMETLSLLKNSKNSGIYSDLFDKNEKEYKKEIKDYEDLRYKVERIVSEKSIPIFDEIRKNEIENIKNDINKEKIIINVRDFHKLEGMLGYKHERSRHLSLIEQGKESYYIPLSGNNLKEVKAKYADFLEMYLELLDCSSFVRFLRIQQALNMFDLPEEAIQTVFKDEYVSNFVKRAIDFERKFSRNFDENEDLEALTKKETKNAKRAKKNIQFRVKRISDLNKSIEDLFFLLTGKEEITLTLNKENNIIIGLFNDNNINHALMCFKLAENHIMACSINKDDINKIKVFEDAEKLNAKLCSFHSVENLMTEIKTDFATQYFFPEIKENYEVILNY